MIEMSSQMRPVLEVREVEPDEVVEREAGAAGDLPEAGHARKHRVAAAVPVLEQLVVAKRQRPRPDEAHLALQHVHDLRDLVEREAPQEAADAGDTRVVADLEERALGLVLLLELGLQRRRASATIVRNFSIPNSRSPTPMRRSTKRIGPRESSLIASAMSAHTGRPDHHDER